MQPQAYNRATDFTDRTGDDTDNSAINLELDAAALSINEIRDNLKIIQRDDGALANGIVTADALDATAFDAVQASVNAATTAAQNSANAATIAATTANNARDAAIAAKVSAETAREASSLNATNAASSAVAASSSALTATAKASEASVSAATATTQAANAASSATTAVTKASQAAASATSAGSSASTAVAKASEAATSAANAASSAASADSSAKTILGLLSSASPIGSVLLSGTQYLTVSDNKITFAANEDFTIEAFVYRTANTTIYDAIFSLCGGGTGWNSGGNGFVLAVGNFHVSPNGSTNYSSSIALNAWTHIAASRKAGVIRIFINGSQVVSVSNTDALGTGTGVPMIGMFDSGRYGFTGNITNLRVVKGIALYDTAFTPPNAPLGIVSGTKLLMRMSTQETMTKDYSGQNSSITNSGATFSPLDPFGL